MRQTGRRQANGGRAVADSTERRSARAHRRGCNDFLKWRHTQPLGPRQLTFPATSARSASHTVVRRRRPVTRSRSAARRRRVIIVFVGIFCSGVFFSRFSRGAIPPPTRARRPADKSLFAVRYRDVGGWRASVSDR